MLVLTFVWGAQYGLGIRDPDGIIGWGFTSWWRWSAASGRWT